MPRFNPIRGVPAALPPSAAVPSRITDHASRDEDGAATLTLKSTLHTKRQCPIWIGQLTAKVPPKEFSRLNALAKAAGGYWSSYGPVDIHGFIFFDEAKALAFQTLVNPTAAAPVAVPVAVPAAAPVEIHHAVVGRESARAADPCEGRTIWNSDGTTGPCLICPPPVAEPTPTVPSWRQRLARR